MEGKGGGVDFSTELPYFQELWENRKSSSGRHTAEAWEGRANEWIAEIDSDAGDKSVTERVRSMASYLRSRGLLHNSDKILDVGCGLGSFVLNFAQTAQHVTGIDFSTRFIEHAKATAASSGVSNVSFELHDICTLDVEAEGLSGAFDLVFASLSPAVTEKGSLSKFMKMSRAMCCNVSFMRTDDSLLERVIKDVFGGEARSRRDGMGFYALLNLLLLSGYYPETYYFTVETEKRVAPSRKLAEDLAFNLRLDSTEDIDKIMRYLEGKGETERNVVTRFGSILWDVRHGSFCERM